MNKHLVMLCIALTSFTLHAQVNFDEAISGDLNYLYQDTFIATPGTNVWSGIIEPTPGSQQDTWLMIVPPGMEVASVSYTRGPVGSETITFLFNSCITGIPWTTAETLNYTFDPPAGPWHYCMQIVTDWLVNPTPWTVTVEVTGADPCASFGGDTDGDGVCDSADGCPEDPNKTDSGVCGCGVEDIDTDGDTVPDCVDQCPGENDLHDTDADGSPDACDVCPDDIYNDIDGDGLCADVDNCPEVANANQSDIDLDGEGDACDAALDIESVEDNIEATLDTLNLPGNVENSMNAKIDNALVHYCNNGNSNAAINQLNAFINQVNGKRGNPLTNAEADQLIYMANQMILAIQDGTVDCGNNQPLMIANTAIDPVSTLLQEQAGSVDEKFIVNRTICGVPTLSSHPIPAIHEVTLTIALTNDERVTMEIYNEAGIKVDVLLNDQLLSAGNHAILWSAGNKSGLFAVHMKTQTTTSVSRIVVMQ